MMIYQPKKLYIEGTSLIRCKKKVTEVTIPNNIKIICDNAFSNCSYLKSISIPFGITQINKSVFFGCSSLQSISIPSSVTEIDDEAFLRCTSLQSIILPNQLKRIGFEAFRRCTSLQSISIPNSVFAIGAKAFSHCSSLKEIFFQGTLEQWEKINLGIHSIPDIPIHCLNGETKRYKNNLVLNGDSVIDCNECSLDIVIPNNVKTIYSKSFLGCFSLISIKLSNNLKEIKNNAFSNCTSLRIIEFPNTIKSIGIISLIASFLWINSWKSFKGI